MNLFEKIKADRIVAFKSKENIKKDLLGTLIAEASKEDKHPSDEKVISVIKKFIKNTEEVLDIDIGRINYDIAKFETELDILKAYLPKQLSEQGLKDAIVYAYNLGNYDIGSIMKYMKENFNGRYDGKLASSIIKEVLSEK